VQKGKGSTAKDLAAREAELARREQELQRKEAALATAGGAVDPRLIANFPPCLPLVHHDINNDIPDYNKPIMRAYASSQCPRALFRDFSHETNFLPELQFK
jgi:hypothetical protein